MFLKGWGLKKIIQPLYDQDKQDTHFLVQHEETARFKNKTRQQQSEAFSFILVRSEPEEKHVARSQFKTSLRDTA